MGGRVNQRGADGEGSAHTNGGDNPAQLGDRGVGRELLQVRFLDGEHGAHDGGGHADDDQQDVPGHHALEQAGEAKQQVNARLDHSGGVQEGGDRSVRGHCLRQPEVEGNLCSLGERRQGDEDCDDGQADVLALPGGGVQHGRKVGGARGDHANTQGGQQEQAADEGEEEGADRAGLAAGARAGDEEERGQGD